MRVQSVFLVIKSDGSVRAAKKPRLNGDEVAVKVNLRFPDSWGRVLKDEINITLPDFTPEVDGAEVQ